jgi:hypothetical protein
VLRTKALLRRAFATLIELAKARREALRDSSLRRSMAKLLLKPASELLLVV